MVYTIVLFEEENLVEAVPILWFEKGKCIWPIKELDAKRLIETQASPDSFVFKKYKARQLCGEIASLAEAKLKLIKTSNTSDLSSIENKDTRKDRNSCLTKQNVCTKTKKKMSVLPKPLRHSHETDEESIDDEGNDEDEEEKDDTYNNSSIISDTVVSKKDNEDYTIKNYTVEELSHPICNSTLTSSEQSPTQEMPKSSGRKASDNVVLPLADYDFVESSLSEPMLSSLHRGSTDYQLGNSSKSSESFEIFVMDSLKSILDTQKSALRSVLNMKYSANELALRIDQIKNIQGEIDEKLKSFNPMSDNFTETNILYNFPLTNIDEFIDFETKLSESTYKQKLVEELTRLVRSTVGDTVRQIMIKIFHNNLLSKYSYFEGKKMPFQNYKATNVIFKTIRKIPKFKNSISDHDIEGLIKQFLAVAKFRELQKKRSSVQIQSNIT